MQVYGLSPQLYDGSQLHHAFCYENGGPLGPSITYFEGPAEVKDHLVDIEDRLANDFIKSANMWHFIIEIPGASLTETVLWQRTFISKCVNWINNNKDSDRAEDVRQDGDDIMINTGPVWKKLSVSIATLSRFSGLIHVGININVGDGCPVAAIGLREFTARGGRFASDVSKTFADEYNDILRATYKVIEVK